MLFASKNALKNTFFEKSHHLRKGSFLICFVGRLLFFVAKLLLFKNLMNVNLMRLYFSIFLNLFDKVDKYPLRMT